MNTSLRVFLLLLSALFTVNVLLKTVRKKILEKDSILWILLTIPVVVLSVFPNIIIRLADIIGVEYAPTLLYLVCIVFLVYLAFRQSMRISALEYKVKELAQYVSILNQKLTQSSTLDVGQSDNENKERNQDV